MKAIKKMFVNLENKFMLRSAGIKETAEVTERGDHLLEVLGTIIIAVVILILFKDTIVNIFTSALGKTTNSVDGLFNSATNVG